MKKTYIEPKNTVVRVSTETLIASSPVEPQYYENKEAEKSGEDLIMQGREVIKSPDVWEEW